MKEENKKIHEKKKIVNEDNNKPKLNEQSSSELKTSEKSEVKESKEETKAEKKDEAKVEKKPAQEKMKKTEAVVMVDNIPISTKHSAAICKFIKNKKIENAISDLESVLKFKKSVPMVGEIPHRKGKETMSGRFPKKASENFIKLLKSLNANSNYNGLENPIIVEVVANIGTRPFSKFGTVRKKRTHIRIVARDIGDKK